MRAAVDDARPNVQAEDRPIAARLSSAFQRIQTASANTNAEALRSLQDSITRLQTQADAVKHGIANDPRFTAMSPRAQMGLCRALNSLDASQDPDMANAKERLKNDFFGVRPDSYDIENGMQLFSAELAEEFLVPSQQAKVDENGIHNAFVKDTARGNISHIGDVATPSGQPREFYENALRDLVPAQHHRFLPFISMMASQAGLDSAMTFLPIKAELTSLADMHLVRVNIMPDLPHTTHESSITLEGDTLRLTATFDQAFKMASDREGASPVLNRKGTVTMSIDLSAEPRREVVAGKEVLIPQFVLENGNTWFEAPQA